MIAGLERSPMPDGGYFWNLVLLFGFSFYLWLTLFKFVFGFFIVTFFIIFFFGIAEALSRFLFLTLLSHIVEFIFLECLSINALYFYTGFFILKIYLVDILQIYTFAL